MCHLNVHFNFLLWHDITQHAIYHFMHLSAVYKYIFIDIRVELLKKYFLIFLFLPSLTLQFFYSLLTMAVKWTMDSQN